MAVVAQVVAGNLILGRSESGAAIFYSLENILLNQLIGFKFPRKKGNTKLRRKFNKEQVERALGCGDPKKWFYKT